MLTCACAPTDAICAIVMGVLFVATAIFSAVAKILGEKMPEPLEAAGWMVYVALTLGVPFGGLFGFIIGVQFLQGYSDLSEPCGGTPDYDKLSKLQPLVLVSTTITAVGWLLVIWLCATWLMSGPSLCDDDDDDDSTRGGSALSGPQVAELCEGPARVMELLTFLQESEEEKKLLEQQVRLLQQQVRQLQQSQPTQPDLLPRGVDEAHLAEP